MGVEIPENNGNRIGLGAYNEREAQRECVPLEQTLLQDRDLVVVSNRGPVTVKTNEEGELEWQRSGGGLATALIGLARFAYGTWICCAMSEAERSWHSGDISLTDHGNPFRVRFITPDPTAFEGYYNTIANPLLWFLQHSLWDFSRAPTFNLDLWKAWDEGYVLVNQEFAEAVAGQILANQRHSLVFLQDYHLYLVPRMVRQLVKGRSNDYTLNFFTHIPWPGPEDWSFLPSRMREQILSGMCAADLLGFQTRGDALNFLRTCESLLPGARVNYRRSQVTRGNHSTHVRDFPISIDVDALREATKLEETRQFHQFFSQRFAGRQLIVRIDRTEPSKNIVRGFQAYDEMLESYPEHLENVVFLAILVPSRLEVPEYQTYLDELMAAAGRVNARHGGSDWEPVRVLVGESYPRAVAAMQLYDVLLVNPVSDGMNLVAKEGPSINEKDGVIILSERAGAHQQLGEQALVVSPCDVHATAEALHAALVMPPERRHRQAVALRQLIEQEDIHAWLCWQLHEIDTFYSEKA